MRAYRPIVGMSLFVWLSSAVWISAQTYTTTELSQNLVAVDVNAQGQVLGRLGNGGAIWDDGQVTMLHDLGYGSQPHRWSEGSGVAVGSVSYGSLGDAAAEWNTAGTLTVLTHVDGYGSVAVAQNASGVTAGVHGRFDSAYGGPVESAARWDTSQALRVLDTQTGQWSEAQGIDGQGDVWGIDGQNQTVYWDMAGVKHVVPGQTWRQTLIAAVNEAGLAVGFATDPVNAPVEITKDGFTELPQLPSGGCTPVDLTSTGVILGNCPQANGSSVPVLWEHGGIQAQALTVPADVQGFHVVALNDQGAIAGLGFTRVPQPNAPPSTVTRSFLFEPTFAPPSLAMRLNGTTFRAGQTLQADLAITNPQPVDADVYVGVILPDGDTVLWVTQTAPLNGVMGRMSDSPARYVPMLHDVSWPGPLNVVQQNYLRYTFNGTEAPGHYFLLVAWTKPGSLEDDSVDDGDVLAMDWKMVDVNEGRVAAR